MNTYNSFDELAVANSDGFHSRNFSSGITNAPHHSFADGIGGVDFRLEFYERDGILPDKDKQKEISRQILSERKPFYAEIPSGFIGFSKQERVGEIIVYDEKGLRTCNKNDVPNLSSYVQLPSGWEKAIEIIND